MEFHCSTLARCGLIAVVIISITTVVGKDEEKLEKVEKMYSDMNTAKDRKEEAMTMMAPYSDWDQMLTPAPMAIALLGQLMLISTETDFSLEEKTPKDGYKYLKYPNSFRASLVQISNIGWESFNLAHTNMDQIRLHTSNVDIHVKSLVKLLMRGTHDEVEDLVPHILKNIQRIADTCVTLSSDVEKMFIYFMNVTGELLEASTNVKGVYEDKLKDTKIAIEVAKTEEEHAKQEKTKLDEEYNKINEDIGKAQQDFREAIQSSPSSFKMFGLGLVDSLVGVLGAIKIPSFGLHAGSEFEFESMPEEDDQDRSVDSVYKFAEQINKHIGTLVLVLTSGEDIGMKTPDWKNIDNVSVTRATLDSVVKHIERKSYTFVSQKAIKLCKDGIRLSDQLIQMNKNVQVPDEDNLKSLIMEAEDLLTRAEDFLSEAAFHLKHTFSNPKGPRMSKRRGSSSLVQAELDNYRMKVDVTTSLLKDSRKRQERAKKEMKDNNERIMETLVELSKLDLKKIDFDKIRETLVKGLKVLKKEREQWGKMVKFFQIMSNIVKIKFSDSVGSFITYAEIGQKQKLDRDYVEDITRDLVYEQAFQASSIAYFIHSLSSTYVEISNKHLMDQIASLGGLVALDPKTDEYLIKTEQTKLHLECRKAQTEIQAIAKKKQEEYYEYVEKRIDQIQEIKPLIPSAPSRQIKQKDDKLDDEEEKKYV